MGSLVKASWLLKIGAFSMISLVGLGAKYGHKGRLDEDSTVLFNKAQLYHLTNNLGFFVVGFLGAGSVAAKVAIGGFVLGSVLFVVPMYYSAIVGRNPYVSKTMPIGGMGMLAGWFSLLFV